MIDAGKKEKCARTINDTCADHRTNSAHQSHNVPGQARFRKRSSSHEADHTVWPLLYSDTWSGCLFGEYTRRKLRVPYMTRFLYVFCD